MDKKTSKKKKKNNAKKRLIIISAIGVFFIAMLCITLFTKITKVAVSGTSYYTDEQMDDFFFGDGQSRSPIVFFFRKTFGANKPIPFVEDYDVSFTGLTSIKVELEVKSMVGYVDFLDSNLYFNREGLVVESTHGLYPDIPKVTGLKLSSVVLGEELPVESKTTLTELLEITQFLTKTSLTWEGKEQTLINVVDRIHFDTNSEINCYVGNVTISLGTGYNLEQKLQEMADIIPSISDKAGTLHLEGYSATSGNHVYRFEEDKLAESKAAEESATAEGSADIAKIGEEGAESSSVGEASGEAVDEQADSVDASEDSAVSESSMAAETTKSNSGATGAGIGALRY